MKNSTSSTNNKSSKYKRKSNKNDKNNKNNKNNYNKKVKYNYNEVVVLSCFTFTVSLRWFLCVSVKTMMQINWSTS